MKTINDYFKLIDWNWCQSPIEYQILVTYPIYSTIKQFLVVIFVILFSFVVCDDRLNKTTLNVDIYNLNFIQTFKGLITYVYAQNIYNWTWNLLFFVLIQYLNLITTANTSFHLNQTNILINLIKTNVNFSKFFHLLTKNLNPFHSFKIIVKTLNRMKEHMTHSIIVIDESFEKRVKFWLNKLEYLFDLS